MYYSKWLILKKKAIAITQLVLGGLITIFIGTIWILLITDGTDDDNLLCVIIFMIVALGIKVLISGIQNMMLIINFKKYMNVLPFKSTCSIHWLSNEVRTSPEKAKNNLQKMIDKKFFLDDLASAYIDAEKNTLVFPNFVAEDDDYEEEECCHHHHCCEDEEDEDDLANHDEHTDEVKVAQCPNCGGINKVAVGQIHSCEYCGSRIIVKK